MDKINGKFIPPPPPLPIKDGKMGRFRFCAASSWIWVGGGGEGDGGFLFHFILSKIAASSREDVSPWLSDRFLLCLRGEPDPALVSPCECHV